MAQQCDILSAFSDDAIYDAKDNLSNKRYRLQDEAEELKHRMKRVKQLEKVIDIELALRRNPIKDEEEEEEEEFFWHPNEDHAAQAHFPASGESAGESAESGESAGGPAGSGAAESEAFLGGFDFNKGASSNRDQQHDNSSNTNSFSPISSDDSSIMNERFQ